MTQIYVKVKPGEKEFYIEKDTYPVIGLESEPENGKANQELMDRLEEILGHKPGIVSGHRSRRKKIAVDLPEEEVKDKLYGE